MKLRPYMTKSVPLRQRTRLEAWLREWDVHRSLPETVCDEYPSAEGGAPDMAEVKVPVSPLSAEPKPASGQIRLLSPGLTGAYDRPVFVAILREMSEVLFMCAPFGMFAEPAVPGELVLRPDVAPLRVLCLWNAREFRKEVIGLSWLIDALSNRELREARIVFSHHARGESLPAIIEKRVGPPIIHPLDPRRTYIEEEATRFLECVREGSVRKVLSLRDGNARAGYLPLAAESTPPTYGEHKPRKSRRRGPRKRHG